MDKHEKKSRDRLRSDVDDLVPESGAYLGTAGVRAGDESDCAQRQRDAVRQHPPSVPVGCCGGCGRVAQWREYERQEGAGYRAERRHEQAQVRYQGGRDDCNNNGDRHNRHGYRPSAGRIRKSVTVLGDVACEWLVIS